MLFISLPNIGCLVTPVDGIVSLFFDLIRPVRFLFWFFGGIIYTVYSYTFALPFHIATTCGSFACGVDPSYYSRCTNSRNFFLMSVMYAITTRLTCTRAFTYPFVRPLAWLVENFYLIPCPVLRAESLLDPVTHENVYPANYTSIWDRMCCV